MSEQVDPRPIKSPYKIYWHLYLDAKALSIKDCSLREIPFFVAILRQFALTIFCISVMVALGRALLRVIFLQEFDVVEFLSEFVVCGDLEKVGVHAAYGVEYCCVNANGHCRGAFFHRPYRCSADARPFGSRVTLFLPMMSINIYCFAWNVDKYWQMCRIWRMEGMKVVRLNL